MSLHIALDCLFVICREHSMNSRSPVNSVNGFKCINKRFCTHTRFEPVTHPEWRRLIGYYCISAVGGLGPPRHIALCQFTRCPWRETRSMKLHAALIITFNDTCCFSGAQDAVNKCPLLRCDYGYKKKHIRLRIFHVILNICLVFTLLMCPKLYQRLAVEPDVASRCL